MTNQDFSRTSGASSGKGAAQDVKDAATDAFSKASDMARETGSKAKRAASDTVFSVNEHVLELLDKQIGNSWGFAGQVAKSFKLAADDLNEKSPFIADLVRTVADKVESQAEDFHDQTVEQVMRSASDFSRRQPALVFGLAALGSFLLFRTLKTVQRQSS